LGEWPPGRPCKVAVQRMVYVFSEAMYQPTRLSASVYALAHAATFRPRLQQAYGKLKGPRSRPGAL
jgi:hypothetical protein